MIRNIPVISRCLQRSGIDDATLLIAGTARERGTDQYHDLVQIIDPKTVFHEVVERCGMRQRILRGYTEIVAILRGEEMDCAGKGKTAKTLDDPEFEHQQDGIVMPRGLLVIVVTFDGFNEGLQDWRTQEG